MQSSSVLSFTYEISVNGKIPFLDVNIKTQDGQFVSDVYRKTTNDGKLLNAKSECPALLDTNLVLLLVGFAEHTRSVRQKTYLIMNYRD